MCLDAGAALYFRGEICQFFLHFFVLSFIFFSSLFHKFEFSISLSHYLRGLYSHSFTSSSISSLTILLHLRFHFFSFSSFPSPASDGRFVLQSFIERFGDVFHGSISWRRCQSNIPLSFLLSNINFYNFLFPKKYDSFLLTSEILQFISYSLSVFLTHYTFKGEIEVFVSREGHVTEWHCDFQENFTIQVYFLSSTLSLIHSLTSTSIALFQLQGSKTWELWGGMPRHPIRGFTPHFSTYQMTSEMQMKALLMANG